MEREVIDRGNQHEIFEAKQNGWYLKKPRKNYILIFNLFGFKPSIIRDEIQNAEKLLENTKLIKVPQTRIFLNTKGYVQAQRIIYEDESIVDIRKALEDEGIQLLVDKFDLDPRNFRSFAGSIYWLDPIKGNITRILERFGLTTWEQRTGFKAWIHRKLGI